ncbi:MAG: glycosyltransferase family 4 protein [Firmicutes bacterium]|nr:glycosyltransferase family 4 protein [Bacillota bacterium]
MKILIIHHSGLHGGAGISLYNTWLELQDYYEVVTYIPNSPSQLFDFLTSKGLKPKVFPFKLGKITHYSGGNSLLQPRFWYHALHSMFQVKYWQRIEIEENPDLIIVNSKVLSWMGKIFKKSATLCFVRETIAGKTNSLINKYMNRNLENFSAVSFLSEFDLKQTNLKKTNAFVVPDFLDKIDYIDSYGKTDSCKKLNIPFDSTNILFVGGINRLKGVDLVLKALVEIKNEKISLIIAGNDDGVVNESNLIRYYLTRIKKHKQIVYSKKIKDFIRKNKIEEKVYFIGIQKNISLAYSASDFLIFPMIKPHQARPVFEIGVQKKTAVISDFPNIRELIVHDVNGLTFSPGKYASLSFLILKLVNDPALLKRLGENNYKMSLSRHSKENALRILLEQIRLILQKKKVN